MYAVIIRRLLRTFLTKCPLYCLAKTYTCFYLELQLLYNAVWLVQWLHNVLHPPVKSVLPEDASLSLLLFSAPALGNILDLLHPSPLVKQLTSH